MQQLSVIIPVYNEEATIANTLLRVSEALLPQNLLLQIVIVNDKSTDCSQQIIQDFIQQNSTLNIVLQNHEHNQGKGACIQTAIQYITGDFVLIQDADLEYHPENYIHLLQPLVTNQADVVYGSRFVGGKPHRVLFFGHTLANKFITFCSNILTNLNLTDIECGYKAFNSKVLLPLKLKEKRFGIEPEITAKIAKIPSIKIYEVGISYYGRTYKEGKKITAKDGIWALWCILKYNLSNS